MQFLRKSVTIKHLAAFLIVVSGSASYSPAYARPDDCKVEAHIRCIDWFGEDNAQYDQCMQAIEEVYCLNRYVEKLRQHGGSLWQCFKGNWYDEERPNTLQCMRSFAGLE